MGMNSGAHRVILVKNPVISHQRGKDREVFKTSGTYFWFIEIVLVQTVPNIFSSNQPIILFKFVIILFHISYENGELYTM